MNRGAQLFKKAREALGWSQVAVGDEIDTSERQIQLWEKGEGKPGRTKSVAIETLPEPPKGRWPSPGDWDLPPLRYRGKK